MEVEGVQGFVLRLVGAAEADEIGRDDAVPGRGDDRDHLPVEVGPRGLAVQHEHRRGIGGTFVDVVGAQVARRVWFEFPIYGAVPLIPSGSYKTTTEFVPGTPNYSAGDEITMDVTSIGGTNPGSDLAVIVRVQDS